MFVCEFDFTAQGDSWERRSEKNPYRTPLVLCALFTGGLRRTEGEKGPAFFIGTLL